MRSSAARRSLIAPMDITPKPPASSRLRRQSSIEARATLLRSNMRPVPAASIRDIYLILAVKTVNRSRSTHSVGAAMDDVILTGLTVKDGARVYYLDNPAHRQRYVKFLNSKQKAKFAKDFLRAITKAEEYQRWYNKMLKR
jgi:hypothetical protein